MKNLSINFLSIQYFTKTSPFFISNNYQNFNYLTNINTFYFFSKFLIQNTNLNNKISFSFFKNYLNSIIIFDSNYFNFFLNSRIVSVGHTVFELCSFISISSTSNGGCFYNNLNNQNTTFIKCNFISCSTTQYGGAIYIESNCGSLKILNSCFNNCFGSETHTFRVLSSNFYFYNLLIFQCNINPVSSYGAFLVLSKIEGGTKLNSSHNMILHHGPGIWFDYSNEKYISDLNIFNCTGRGINVIMNSNNFHVNFMNFINNKETMHGLLYINNNALYSNSLFISNFGNYIFGSLITFSNCIFDIDKLTSATYINVNFFKINTYTLIVNNLINLKKCEFFFETIHKFSFYYFPIIFIFNFII